MRKMPIKRDLRDRPPQVGECERDQGAAGHAEGAVGGNMAPGPVAVRERDPALSMSIDS